MICAGCSSPVGLVNGQEYRLLKASLKIEGQQAPDQLFYLVAEMLSTLDAHAVHRFLLKSKDLVENLIVVWILTPDARITGTDVSRESPGQRVTKVMFRHGMENDADDEELEIMEISSGDLHQIRDRLQKNHEIIGLGCSKEWQSSFLARYEVTLHDGTQ